MIALLLAAALQCPDGSPPPCRTSVRAADRSPVLDPELIAVMPFRVSGAHASLAYLREGMLDLLATKLTGEGVPRAIDPRSIMAAWRREAAVQREITEAATQRIARRLGAGRVIDGSIVGTPVRLIVTARLRDAGDTGRRTETTVAGHPDSILVLTDRLVSQLLAGAAGVRPDAIARLTTTSLPALREYLLGLAAFRRGRNEEAVAHFVRATELDSAFALAGLELAVAAANTGNIARSSAGVALAWTNRAALTPRDLLRLRLRAGPRYPEPSPRSEVYAIRLEATRMYPDRSELWFEYGDIVYHNGGLLGLTDPVEQSRVAFERALALDSLNSVVVLHLLELSALRADSQSARRLWQLWPARDSIGEQADFARWLYAVATGDVRLRERSRAHFERMVDIDLQRVTQFALPTATGLEDADSTIRVRRRRPTSANTMINLRAYYLNRARPREIPDLETLSPEIIRVARRSALYDAALGDGDSAVAERAARALSRGVADGYNTADNRERSERLLDLGALAVSQLQRGAPLAAELVQAMAGSNSVAARANGAMLDAWSAVNAGRPDARDRVARLDSLVRTGEPGTDVVHAVVAARLWERLDEPDRALPASRRMVWRTGAPQYLSTMLLIEARSAQRLNQQEAAIRAMRIWLAMRDQPEAAFMAQRDSVRAALALLERR